ncbi:MAG: hypothetical protein CM15mP59_1510 [Flavobacteriaceae bacterium]|nr:MAG: hypothetical protein CM15mP59_1510 [Flavobacteriaceae bacterium]
MGADLFGSYVATVLASMVLGNYIIKDMSEAGQTLDTFQGMGPILLPLVLAGVGIIASIAGTLFIRIKDNSAKEAEVQRALNTGNIFSILLTLIASWFLIDYLLPETISGMKFLAKQHVMFFNQRILCNHRWIGCWYLISLFTEILYGYWQKPVMSIVQNSSTGAATNIIAGLSVGMISTASSVLLFAVAFGVHMP